MTKLNIVKLSDYCGEVIKDSQFLLESLNYPDEYPTNLNCEIIVEGDKCPLFFKFRFLDFKIESSSGCTKDRLEIDNTDALCGTKNGTKLYFAKSGMLKLRFITDKEKSDRGYKILVTRIGDCSNKTQNPNVLSTSPIGRLNACCSSTPQNTKHFFIKSPNFPVSMSFPNDCFIQIRKFSTDTCRLRIRFNFFWLGNSLDCKEGFLQLDGKYICGCMKELNLISNFEEDVKLLRFKSEGFVKNSYGGFSAEIFQDDCPKKVRSKLTESTLTPLKRDKKTILSHLYFFTYPQEISIQKEKEETDYLFTENIRGILGNTVNDYRTCLQWNQFQFNNLYSGREIHVEQCEKIELMKRNVVYNFLRKRIF
ncbi:hypothetical protein HHI36_005942 [Cryptolaemus montrouzieri]|uniref:CUB domain-containing protein n=1 Tax=Cryptolaemus montrouzieri TaxID=559131 RepID=A0ABD2NVW7_9CUCU